MVTEAPRWEGQGLGARGRARLPGGLGQATVTGLRPVPPPSVPGHFRRERRPRAGREAECAASATKLGLARHPRRAPPDAWCARCLATDHRRQPSATAGPGARLPPGTQSQAVAPRAGRGAGPTRGESARLLARSYGEVGASPTSPAGMCSAGGKGRGEETTAGAKVLRSGGVDTARHGHVVATGSKVLTSDVPWVGFFFSSFFLHLHPVSSRIARKENEAYRE